MQPSLTILFTVMVLHDVQSSQNIVSSYISNINTKSNDILQNGIANGFQDFQKNSCGHPINDTIKPVMNNGKYATLGQFPWAVAIYDKYKNYLLICSGSIISPFAVLSAAHCFFDYSTRSKRDAEDYMIVVSKVSRDYYVDDSDETKRHEVERIIVEGFLGIDANFISDVAILQVKSEIQFSSFVGAVCLPQRDLIVRTGILLNVFGWGIEENKVTPTELKNHKLPYLTYTDCYYNLNEENRHFLDSDKFCIKHVNGIVLTEGDGGSGLTYQERLPNSQHYLVGIFSFTEINVAKNEVSVITNILRYEDFLLRSLREIHETKDFSYI